MQNLYYRDSHACILTYSIEERRSFDNIENWLSKVYEHNAPESMTIALVGNKCDCDNDDR